MSWYSWISWISMANTAITASLSQRTVICSPTAHGGRPVEQHFPHAAVCLRGRCYVREVREVGNPLPRCRVHRCSRLRG